MAIVGDGGTSAAVAAFLAQADIDGLAIDVIGSNPFLDSRAPNFFSDRLYGDFENWSELPISVRTEFLSRTQRGRIWSQVIDEIQNYPSLRYHSGRVERAEVRRLSPEHSYIQSFIQVPGLALSEFSSDAMVDARGFDNLWFRRILSDDLSLLLTPGGLDFSGTNDWIQGQIDLSICVSVPNFPPGLHVPMLGARVHPASNNLMALGGMADRVLSRYR